MFNAFWLVPLRSVLWGVLFVQLSSKWWVARLEERDVWVERCPCAAF